MIVQTYLSPLEYGVPLKYIPGKLKPLNYDKTQW